MKLCTTFLPFAGLCALGLVAAAAVNAPQQKPAPAPGGAQQPGKKADAPVDAGMPKAAPEHALLKKLVGTWDAKVTMMVPGMPAEASDAKAVYKAVGDTWVQSDFTGEVAGSSFVGHGIDGYDTLKKKYVGTWVDSMSTEFLIMEGTHDAATKTTTMTGSGHDPATGKLVKYRTTCESKDNDSMVFRMYATEPEGKEAETMKIEYKRSK